MDYPTLRGCSILVVEDEPLIAMDIVTALEGAGANATTTTTVRHALILAEHDGLSAAIMDHALNDDDSTALCAKLKFRGIPYVCYSGCGPVEGASGNSIYIAKPVSMEVLMNALEALLVGKSRRVPSRLPAVRKAIPKQFSEGACRWQTILPSGATTVRPPSAFANPSARPDRSQGDQR